MTVPMRVAPISLEAKYGTDHGYSLLKEDIRNLYHLLSAQGIDGRYLAPSLKSKIARVAYSGAGAPEQLAYSTAGVPERQVFSHCGRPERVVYNGIGSGLAG